jgi:hypothetical protein
MGRLRRLFRSESGAMSVEAVIILPILIWALFGTFTIFEAFRSRSVTLKASYTVADMISRQVDALNPAAINGLNSVFDFLTLSNQPTWIRVTSVFWDAGQKKFRVAWSHGTRQHAALTDATLQGLVQHIPAMAIGDTVVMLETYMHFEPAFDIGIDFATGLTAGERQNVIVTRPRFASQVVFSPS